MYIDIDIAKTFDKVCHSKLLLKMYNLEINGNVLKWFNSYIIILFFG